MHVLFFHGTPEYRAERWQRLSMAMATYSKEDQTHHLHIEAGDADVPILT